MKRHIHHAPPPKPPSGHPASPMPGRHAIRLLHAGAVCVGFRFCLLCLCLLQGREGGAGVHFRGAGAAVPTFLQDCAGPHGMECG